MLQLEHRICVSKAEKIALDLVPPTCSVDIPEVVLSAQAEQYLISTEKLPMISPCEGLDCAASELRIAYILNCTRKAGFKDFDALVAEYYCADLDVISVAHKAQRISRSRGLRHVLQSIRNSARTWSDYECNGYKDEIFRSAEALYRGELKKASGAKTLSKLLSCVKGAELEEDTDLVKCRAEEIELQNKV